MADTARRTALAGRSVTAPAVTVTPAAPAFRISLRAGADAAPALAKALGVELPTRPKGSATAGKRSAWWLGPDEWFVLDEAADLLASLEGVPVPHSAVDISHRNVGIAITGPGAATCLSAGCPQDLSLAAFPVGTATRTVLGKVEILLWRTAPDAFRLECWRSFSTYVMDFLEEAAGDAGR